MRQYRRLEHVSVGPEGALVAAGAEPGAELLARHEGEAVALSFFAGAVEISLRLKAADLARTLAQLQPADAIGDMRQVGTAQSALGLSLRPDGTLVLRPMLTADAAGMLALSFEMSAAARQALIEWLKL